MDNEPQGEPQIVLIAGPMFSEKTGEVIRKCMRHKVAGKNVEIFKPKADTRSKDAESRCGASWENTISFEKPMEILTIARKKNLHVAGIDEAQLCGEEQADELCEVVLALYEQSITVYIATLDTDYNAKPFKIYTSLVIIPEVKILKLTAICFDCKRREAARSFRIDTTCTERLEVGDSDKYIALCYKCFKRRIS